MQECRTTKDRFRLKCKVVSTKIQYRDLQSFGKSSNETAEVILLLPEPATETDCFFHAWLPEKLSVDEIKELSLKDKNSFNKTFAEIVMETGFPILGYFRGAVSWESAYFNQPHIFVMTASAEEKLKSKVGEKIELTVLGDGEEANLYELKLETRSPYADIE